jgi:uncharacterized protein (TIGR02145 family)
MLNRCIDRPALLRISIVVGFVCSLLGVSSCQDKGTQSHTGPVEVEATFPYADDWKTPDSLTWSIGSDAQKSVEGQEITAVRITGKFTLPSPTRDSIYMGLWLGGMRFAVMPFTQEGSSTTLSAHTAIFDSIGKVLIRICSTKIDRNRDTLLARYARGLVNGTPVLAGFPGNCPVGIDTAQVVRLALLYALQKGGTIREAAKVWSLGLDSTKASELVVDMVKSGDVDSAVYARAFPRYPVRVKTGLILDSVSVGQSLKVGGRFEGDSGLIRFGYTVRKDGNDAKRYFRVQQGVKVLDGTQKSWDLRDDQELVLIDDSAALGSYQLVYWMVDKNGCSDTAREFFKVVPNVDRTAPVLLVDSPRPDSVLESKDSFLVVRIRATDNGTVDSVKIQEKRVSPVNGWYVDTVIVPASGLAWPIRLRAWDAHRNLADSTIRVTRRSESIDQMIRLVRRSPGASFDGELRGADSILHVEYIATSSVGIDDSAVHIEDTLATRMTDSVWTRDIRVADDGKSRKIEIRFKDRNGREKTDRFQVVRYKDTIGPVVTLVSPSKDTSVENGPQTILVRVEVSDPDSGVAVSIDGKVVSTVSGNSYVGQVALPSDGSTKTVEIVALDWAKNPTVVRFQAKWVPPLDTTPTSLRLIEPSIRKGNKMTADQDSFTVRWSVKSGKSIAVVALKIGAATASLDKDSAWTAKVPVPASGLENAIPCLVVDSRGDTVRDTIWVTRAKPLPKPTLVPAVDSTRDPLLVGGVYGTFSDKLVLRWKVVGECAECEFRVDGTRAELVNGGVERTIDLAFGPGSHSLQAMLGSVELANSEIKVRRYHSMSLRRIAPTGDTIALDDTTTTAQWKAQAAASVAIDGVKQILSASETYSTSLRSLAPRENVVRLQATDSLGYSDSVVLRLYKMPLVDLSMVPTKTGDLQWDSAQYAIASSTPGAVLVWSTDSSSWKPVPADGKVVVNTSGRVFAKATCPAYVTNSVSGTSVAIRHTNSAPRFSVKGLDSVKVLEDAGEVRQAWADSISKGGEWDSAQTLSFKLIPVGDADMLFQARPRIDSATGMLVCQPNKNAFGAASYSVVLKDNGGVENNGRDTSIARNIVISIASVNDAPGFIHGDSVFSDTSFGMMLGDSVAVTLPVIFGGGAGSWIENGSGLSISLMPLNDVAANGFRKASIASNAPIVTPSFTGSSVRLEFASNSLQIGDAIFALRVKDTGGVANRGVDSAILKIVIRLDDSFKDAAGNIYHMRKIGSKVWMRENIGSTCTGCARQGTSFLSVGLAAAACPSGWTLPSASDWSDLNTAAGGAVNLRVSNWQGWFVDSEGWYYDNYPATGKFQFNLAPTVWQDVLTFNYPTEMCNAKMWTSTSAQQFAQFGPELGFTTSTAAYSSPMWYGNLTGASVRCVK